MTPDEFLRRIEKAPGSAHLFLGPEPLLRERCRVALIERCLPPDQREHGFTRHDLDETELASALDDARSMSLFASARVVWIGSCEAALPRGRAVEAKDESAAEIADYVRNAPAGVVVVFDCSRYDFEGDDKAKLQRVEKFYAAVTSRVEFPRFSVASARALAGQIAKEKNIRIAGAELDLLVEALGADGARIATELEKLSVFAGTRAITADDIWNLIPDSKTATIFQLVAAIGRGNRMASLQALDVLVRDGEYLPLALSFLGTQFRLALAAKEAGLRNASQIQAHFTNMGTPMWRSRAEQVQQTVEAFPIARLQTALHETYAADRAIRDVSPDDRIVMEQFVLRLT